MTSAHFFVWATLCDTHSRKDDFVIGLGSRIALLKKQLHKTSMVHTETPSASVLQEEFPGSLLWSTLTQRSELWQCVRSCYRIWPPSPGCNLAAWPSLQQCKAHSEASTSPVKNKTALSGPPEGKSGQCFVRKSNTPSWGPVFVWPTSLLFSIVCSREKTWQPIPSSEKERLTSTSLVCESFSWLIQWKIHVGTKGRSVHEYASS